METLFYIDPARWLGEIVQDSKLAPWTYPAHGPATLPQTLSVWGFWAGVKGIEPLGPVQREADPGFSQESEPIGALPMSECRGDLT